MLTIELIRQLIVDSSSNQDVRIVVVGPTFMHAEHQQSPRAALGIVMKMQIKSLVAACCVSQAAMCFVFSFVSFRQRESVAFGFALRH